MLCIAFSNFLIKVNMENKLKAKIKSRNFK